MSELKNQISQFIDTNAKIYQDISLAIHAKPEVSDFEYFASQTLSEQLKKEGYTYCSEKTVRNRLKKLNLDASRTQKLEDVTIELRYKKEKS